MKRLATLLAAFVLATMAPASVKATPGQLVNWRDMCAMVTNGQLRWSGSTPSQCTSAALRVVSWSEFTTYVSNSGCTPSATSPPGQADMLACRVLISLHTQSFAVSGETATSSPAANPPPNYTCSLSGSTTATITTPSGTLAPTSTAHQLSWAPTSVGGGGTGVTLTLTSPTGTTALSNVPVSNGSTTAVTYSNSSAPAGVWTWTVSGLGAQACNVTTGAIITSTQESASGSIGWYQ